jgi:catechol 2,3-dioxygenase-like lactoylglutathione lyase family enzyme
MAKLRHIAINCEDIEADAKFYTAAFDLKEVGRAGTEANGAIYLSDGVMNVALIKITRKEAPNFTPRGLNHIGFIVKDLDEAIARAEAAGAVATVDRNDKRAGVTWEMKMKTPTGVAFDFSDHGWPGVGALS